MPTFPYESLAQISAMAHDNIAAENRGSTDAEPRHVREINFVFIVVHTPMVVKKCSRR